MHQTRALMPPGTAPDDDMPESRNITFLSLAKSQLGWVDKTEQPQRYGTLSGQPVIRRRKRNGQRHSNHHRKQTMDDFAAHLDKRRPAIHLSGSPFLGQEKFIITKAVWTPAEPSRKGRKRIMVPEADKVSPPTRMVMRYERKGTTKNLNAKRHPVSNTISSNAGTIAFLQSSKPSGSNSNVADCLPMWKGNR